MDKNIIPFPLARVAKAAVAQAKGQSGTVIALERRARPHRTPTGVFFMTHVLTTTGDYA